MGVAPRSDAIEKYETDAMVNVIRANWWNTRVPFGLCRWQHVSVVFIMVG